MLASCVDVHGEERQPDGQQGEPVDGDRDPLGAGALAQRVGHHPGRERKEPDQQQEQQVQAEQDRIGPLEAFGQGVMADPRRADGHEADDIGQIGRPTAQELLQRRTRRPDRHLQHEQGDGDGDDPVAERLHPRRAQTVLPVLSLPFLGHNASPRLLERRSRSGHSTLGRPARRASVRCDRGIRSLPGAGRSWGSSRVNAREMSARRAAPRSPALSDRSWACS